MLTLPARHPVTDADVERLAQSVAEHLTGADFDEPAGNRLRLSVRADLLFVKVWSTAAAHAAFTRRCCPLPT